jgi:hypothetical protein
LDAGGGKNPSPIKARRRTTAPSRRLPARDHQIHVDFALESCRDYRVKRRDQRNGSKAFLSSEATLLLAYSYRRQNSFSHGAEWNTLINKYIGIIPLRGDACCIAAHRILGTPPPKAVSNAMMAKVGVAARQRQ